jgi:hypothetical protein
LIEEARKKGALEVHEQLAAGRFILVNEEGNPAAYITGAEAGFISFHVEGPEEGHPLVSIGFQAGTNLPTIRLALPQDGGDVLITVTESGRAGIFLADADGTERLIATTP